MKKIPFLMMYQIMTMYMQSVDSTVVTYQKWQYLQ